MKLEEIQGIKLDKNGKIYIPNNIEKLKFDIGLSWCAPNTATWIDANPRVYVFSIEPNKECFNRLTKEGVTNRRTIKKPYPSENYTIINCAIDNVSQIKTSEFYHMNGDLGCSSLLRPTDSLSKLFGYSIKETYKVNVLPLRMILERIPYNRFPLIDMVKIDVQGKDLDVIKSIGEYIDRIVFINAEVNTFDYYEGNTKPEVFDEYMESVGFEEYKINGVWDGNVVDKTYVNKRYKNLLGVEDSVL